MDDTQGAIRYQLVAADLALPVAQAAAALGLSETNFRNHVLPHVRSIEAGRARIVPVIELGT